MTKNYVLTHSSPKFVSKTDGTLISASECIKVAAKYSETPIEISLAGIYDTHKKHGKHKRGTI